METLLIEWLKERIADPVRAVDAAAWVCPRPIVAPTATAAEVDAAQAALGFELPPLLRRLYLEVGNGGFGPAYGLVGVPSVNSSDAGADIVVLYQAYSGEDPENPNWNWPRGLVPLVGIGCNILECISCLAPPYPLLRFDPHQFDWDRPLTEWLISVAPSLESYLETWLAEGETSGCGA